MTLLVLRRTFVVSCRLGKSACSIVPPVHHLVQIDKQRLSPKLAALQLGPGDPRSASFRPQETRPDRVRRHYETTLAPDLLLMCYEHEADTRPGLKRREWDGTSPYHINRPLRAPKGSKAARPDIHPVKWSNIPELEKIVINCFVNDAKENQHLAIAAALQLQQITGVKPKAIYSKTDVPTWRLRRGQQMGAKVVLTGVRMSQFLSTLTEIVLPRIREYRGIPLSSGDTLGNISFGLTHENVRFFPELDANPDLWPRIFGMQINLCTSAQSDEHARRLLSGLQLPFAQRT